MAEGEVEGRYIPKQGPTLRALKNAAERKDSRAFAEAAGMMKWFQHSPADIMRAIDWALELDMAQLAMDLAQQGHRLFPQDDLIRKAAAVLSPPAFVGIRQVQIRDLEASQGWLREHAAEYKGRWVAVRGGKLRGIALTLKDLHKQIGLERNTPDMIIVKVLR